MRVRIVKDIITDRWTLCRIANTSRNTCCQGLRHAGFDACSSPACLCCNTFFPVLLVPKGIGVTTKDMLLGNAPHNARPVQAPLRPKPVAKILWAKENANKLLSMVQLCLAFDKCAFAAAVTDELPLQLPCPTKTRCYKWFYRSLSKAVGALWLYISTKARIRWA